MPAFIETQFPIARLSAESYKERKANNGQTLTRLGKWWGRKPLILARAAIVGMIMPASANAQKDRDVFLQILTMDDDGAWHRCKPEEARRLGRATLQASAMASLAEDLRVAERSNADVTALLDTLNAFFNTRAASLAALQSALGERSFHSMPYAERIALCERPENTTGPTPRAWEEINAHLGTRAESLAELMDELGRRDFGRTPRLGDSFCGGGSIPFEAARIGCAAFASDLNPIAGLLTWSSLNLLAGGAEVQREVAEVQAAVLEAADAQVAAWRVEQNDRGERADAFLYCVEVKPGGCDYYIPLAPGWLIGERSRVVCRWRRVPGSDRLHPDICVVDENEVRRYKAKAGATLVEGRVIDPFDATRSWSLESLRGPNGLRPWTRDDVETRPEDVFQERLYCIRWTDGRGERRYAAPEDGDLAREREVSRLLRERWQSWQSSGFIPSLPIPAHGAETARLSRERGWTWWHHFFTPRQLLTHGLLAQVSNRLARTRATRVACLLGLGRIANWDSRGCGWMWHAGNEKGDQTFNNQALNTLVSYAGRGMTKLGPTFSLFGSASQVTPISAPATVSVSDARDLRETCDLWVTDPPYADAVNYHELGDFFLAWCEKSLSDVFPEWMADARSELAVQGNSDDFRNSMVEVYRNLTRHMPDNGLQMVMFTHQNPAVWADLGMILWASGLKATAAWTISTETESAGIKKGNYVQGTVCLVLRKRVADEPGFLDEVYPLVEDEVRRQIASMQALDEGGEPNFNDSDYQLAAYAAALKVLTQYGNLDGRNVEHELFAQRGKGDKSDFQAVIERALMIACDALIPRGLETSWRELGIAERYYLRALDIESRGERRQGMYEELARGFGLADIRPLLKSDKANGARMHTASGFGSALLAAAGAREQARAGRSGRASATPAHPFAGASVRHLLFAVRETALGEDSPEAGRQYLRDTFGQTYWSKRDRCVTLLMWLSRLGDAAGMAEWASDSRAARILAGRLRNDHA